MGQSRTRALIAAGAIAACGFIVWRVVKRRSRTAARYRKHEYRIAMRDGVTLFTQVYIPRDTSRSYPILMTRTPFGVAPYGETNYRRQLGPSVLLDRAGYIFVLQDVRGRYQSEGEFVDMRPHRNAHAEQPAAGPTSAGPTDESTDAYDTIEWLLKNVPGNDGNVGVWGMSYPGFYTAAALIDAHPAIRAASPQAPVTDVFRGDDAFHNGAFMLAQQFGIYANYFRPRSGGLEFPPLDRAGQFSYATEDGYAFFLENGPELRRFAALARNPMFDTNVQHNTYDTYWQARNLAPHLENTRCPVLIVGGWFDAEDLAGTLATYHAIAQQNPGVTPVLVMGPWAHGGWLRTAGREPGAVAFGSAPGEFLRDRVLFPFFEHYLKGKDDPHLPKVLVFETGTNRWVRHAEWPPKSAYETALFLRAGGKLALEPPQRGEAGFDQYVSDPRTPVPYLEQVPTRMGSEYMYADQRFAAQRKDVLTYASEPVHDDITIAGPITVKLEVSSSGTDADFVVKLIDVYPDGGKNGGYAQLVRGEPMRAKFRNSWTTPEPLIADEVTAIHFDMPDVYHTFRRGHRVMVQVQSSWFPLVDLNPQRYMNIAEAQAADFQRATQRVWHDEHAQSQIVVRILPRG